MKAFNQLAIAVLFTSSIALLGGCGNAHALGAIPSQSASKQTGSNSSSNPSAATSLAVTGASDAQASGTAGTAATRASGSTSTHTSGTAGTQAGGTAAGSQPQRTKAQAAVNELESEVNQLQ